MDWKKNGVKVVHAGELDMNTPQTSGMTRAAAITHAKTGATKLWAGTMLVQPDAKTGPHHHGKLETVLYVLNGRVRMRWGARLEFSDEASAGDFIYVPPFVPHQEINADPDNTCEAVVVRNGQEPVVVNLDLETPEPASAGRRGYALSPGGVKARYKETCYQPRLHGSDHLFLLAMIRTRRSFDARSIKLVIFDLDGTLIDSRLDLVHSVNAALRHIGRPDLPDDVIAGYVGDGAPILIQRALGGEAVDEATVRRGLQFFLSYYREHKLDHTTVYDGVKEALATIQGSPNGARRKMAVLSNKPVVPSRAIVEALGLGQFFIQVYGGNSFATKKPDPEGARKLLDENGVSPAEAVIIGDSPVDVETGRSAGLWTIGVNYGFAPHALHRDPPDVLVDTALELAEVFA